MSGAAAFRQRHDQRGRRISATGRVRPAVECGALGVGSLPDGDDSSRRRHARWATYLLTGRGWSSTCGIRAPGPIPSPLISVESRWSAGRIRPADPVWGRGAGEPVIRADAGNRRGIRTVIRASDPPRTGERLMHHEGAWSGPDGWSGAFRPFTVAGRGPAGMDMAPWSRRPIPYAHVCPAHGSSSPSYHDVFFVIVSTPPISRARLRG